MTRKSLWLFVQLSRPHFLLGAALLYALGAGIAHYLGASIDWGLYFLGQTWVTLIQLSTHYLNEYFDFAADAENSHRTPFSGGSGTLGPGKLRREVALRAALICLGLATYFTIFLLREAASSPVIYLLLALIFLGAFFYSTPPIRLASSGYGELTTAIIVSNLVPGLAFILQNGEYHRVLAMATFPLTFLNLAMILAFEIPDYASDLKHRKTTLMVRIGWERGMLLHNLFLLCAYLVLGLGMIFGLPLAIAAPGFLTLPLGVIQLWRLRRIAEGGRPQYNALTFLSVAIFGITAYLLAFAFWIR
jgi:1,4-dihydroxy-2-naphthoate octaprenyltransferase